MNICPLDGQCQPLTYDLLLLGVAKTEKTLADAVSLAYVEDDAVQEAMAQTLAEQLLSTQNCYSRESLARALNDTPGTIETIDLAKAVTHTFSLFGRDTHILDGSQFPYDRLFLPEPKTITAMGMTDGGRVRVRYTVKRPKEAVRPGNIPNETRMTMANYANEIGVVALRGKVPNPTQVAIANSIIAEEDPNAQPEAVPIGQLDDWLTSRHTCSALKKFDTFTSYYDNIHNVDIYDSLIPGWTKLKKWMKCSDPNLNWFRIKTSTGVNRLFTFDHPLPIKSDAAIERIPMEEIQPGMVMFGCKTDRASGGRRAIPIEVVEHKSVSHDLIPPNGYDVETASDHYDLDTIVTHNCRTKSIA